MSSLDSRQKQLLLDVARRALIVAVERHESLGNLPEEAAFCEHAGAFVTLRCRSRLRGCIGQMNSHEPLVKIVAEAAKSAALEDPRFDPVRPDELAGIDIELSVVSPPEDIAPGQIETGKHGLIISRGWRRGVLLPQVATECRWEGPRFLEETCLKAGLARDAWKDAETRIQAFTAEVFDELGFQAPGAPAGGRIGPRYSIST